MANFIKNGNFEAWSAGDSFAPDEWTATGIYSIGKASGGRRGSSYAFMSSSINQEAKLYQQVPNYFVFPSTTVYFGAWVHTSATNRVRLGITADGSDHDSAYCPDDNVWHFITCSYTVTTTDPVSVYLKIESDTGVGAGIDGAILQMGEAPLDFAPRALEDGGPIYGDLDFRNYHKITGLNQITGLGQVNLIQNGSFESWSAGISNQLPDHWGIYGSPSDISKDTGERDGFGGYGVVKITIGYYGSNEGIYITLSELRPNTAYKVRCRAKANNGDIACIRTVGAYYSDIDEETNATNWTTLEGTFTTTAQGDNIDLQLLGKGSEDIVWFDQVTVVESVVPSSFIPYNLTEQGGEVYGDLTFKGGKTIKGLPTPGANGEAVRYDEYKDLSNLSDPATARTNLGLRITEDSYSESHYSNSMQMYSGFRTAYGQSFISAGILSSCKFYLKKTGSPTGNVVAKLYAHSGTYGSSSVPTGSALATSDPIDVSTLTTSNQLIIFTFSTPYTMSAAYYCIIVEYSGGNSSNSVDVGIDNSTGSHSGNYICYDGSWGYSGADCIFYVYANQSGLMVFGKMSTQSADAVAITGGSISKITDLAVADGGTGASDAATARTNLGLISDKCVYSGGNCTTTKTDGFYDVKSPNDNGTTRFTVTLVTGTTALVTFVGCTSVSTVARIFLDILVSGASSFRVGNTSGGFFDTVTTTANYSHNASFSVLVTGLTPGSNIFTLQWRVDAGTGTLYSNSAFAPTLSVVAL